MRDIKECTAEVFRRSEQIIQNRAKRRNSMKVLSLLVLLPAVLVTLLGGILIQSGGTPNTESDRFVMQTSEDVSRYEVIELPPQVSADKPSDAQNKDNKGDESAVKNDDTNNNKPQDTASIGPSIQTGSNKGEESTLKNDDTSNEEPQAVAPLAPPVPPIQAESINEVVSLLVNSDIKGYRQEFQSKYQEIFSQLKKSGFIYQVVTSDNEAAEDAVTLFEKEGKNLFFVMPYAKYEDVGIVSNVMFRGTLYQIWLYSADEKFLSNDVKISEYLKTRLGWERTEEKNNVCFMTAGDGKDYLRNCAASFIDSNYYYIVKTEASQDKLKTFLDVLSFEKVSIE